MPLFKACPHKHSISRCTWKLYNYKLAWLMGGPSSERGGMSAAFVVYRAGFPEQSGEDTLRLTLARRRRPLHRCTPTGWITVGVAGLARRDFLLKAKTKSFHKLLFPSSRLFCDAPGPCVSMVWARWPYHSTYEHKLLSVVWSIRQPPCFFA